MRRTIVLPDEGEAVEVLRVPWYWQAETEWTCFPHSMKMCLEYFKNIYSNQVINERTPNLDLDSIMSLSNCRRFTGTALDRTILQDFEKRIPFELTLRENCKMEYIKESLDRDLPVIVVYNAAFLVTNERGSAHAGVVIGMTTQDGVILANPWFGFGHHITRIDFERSWELEYNKAVFFRPVPQSTLDMMQ